MQNNNLPRVDKNTVSKNTLIGWGQIIIGALVFMGILGVWFVQRFLFEALLSVNAMPITIFRWIMAVAGLWLISLGARRLYLVDIFKKSYNLLAKGNMTVSAIAGSIGSTPDKYMADLSQLAQDNYWSKVQVADNVIYLYPPQAMFAKQNVFRIIADNDMRFTSSFKSPTLPHIPVLALLVGIFAILPLPLSKVLWFFVAVALSFPAKSLLAKLFPKKKFIQYSAVPEYIPEKIELELSGNEQADELIALGEKQLVQLGELERTIRHPQLKKDINEISAALVQITQVLHDFPDKHRNIRQTLEYSVQTAIKLYYKYIELDNQPVKGENIISAMNKILEMSSLVNSTLKKEVDNLYQDQSLDIEVDVEVMRNMLQQEAIDITALVTKENEAVYSKRN